MFTYGGFSGSYFPIFGLNTEIYFVNLRIQSEYRKIQTRENPYLNTFLAVLLVLIYEILEALPKLSQQKLYIKNLKFTVSNYFRYQDLLSKRDRVYKFCRGSCTASYLGKICKFIKVGSSEHRSVLRKTGKTCQGTVLTLVIDYVLICDHQVACLSKMELFQELFIF